MAIRVLVVDDEDGLRVSLAANLELDGFEVLEAENGAAALAKLSTTAVDVMLTDIRMPGINGVDLFRKAREQHPELPVILMTAFALEALVDDAMAEGVFTVLPKPFEPALAVSALTRAAKRPKVLVVDDVVIDASSTADALVAASVSARAVNDAQAALEALGEGGYDVCVTDLVMPGVSGSELAATVKARHQDVALIAMSGFSVPELMQKVAAAGAVTCLSKPVPPRELLKVIARTRATPRRPS
jgi:DNA-binding NtrC family response regulator